MRRKAGSFLCCPKNFWRVSTVIQQLPPAQSVWQRFYLVLLGFTVPHMVLGVSGDHSVLLCLCMLLPGFSTLRCIASQSIALSCSCQNWGELIWWPEAPTSRTFAGISPVDVVLQQELVDYHSCPIVSRQEEHKKIRNQNIISK